MRTKLSQALNGAFERALGPVLHDRRSRASGRDDARSVSPELLDPADAPGAEGSEGADSERAEVGQSLSDVATRAVVAACVLGALPLIGFGVWAMLQVDQVDFAREQTLLRNGFSSAVESISRQQQTITVWDDAVTVTRVGDQQWMAENVGEWLHSFFGHDRVYVLDKRNQPVYAMIEGVTQAVPSFAGDGAQIQPLVAQLRAEMTGAEALGDLAARDLMTIGGRPSIVSVKPIVPSSDAVVVAPGEEHLHVSVQYMDAAFLEQFETQYMLADVRLTTELAGHDVGTHRGTIDVVGERSGQLGYLTWHPAHPGLHLVERTLPGLIASALSMFSLIGFLLVRLRRAALRVLASETEARHQALHDALTGLPNRAFFNDRLGEVLAAARRDGRGLALHYVDLDRFKIVNDTLGHPAGDELIRQVSERLRALVRRGDTVARLGGDEFAILQRDFHGPEDARQLAERVLREIMAPFMLTGNLAHVGASIGIVLGPEQGDTRDELVRKADIALYQAKGTGKGRFCLFEPELDNIVSQKRAIERDLREALDTGVHLRVIYQPLYSADGVTLVGAEALLRWEHPAHGNVSPAVFVPVAEERGLMPRLGNWVLREACRTARELNLPWIAVNVSAVQFHEVDFVDSVLDLLKETGLSPERLQLEITEGLLLDATDAVASAITKLRFAGVCIALDDFGTGYSSLHYLNRYKVDKIKIDRSFVQQLGMAADSDAIVRAMLDLARALNLDVTAEGVETTAQWEALNSLGAPEMQGYLFSRPVDRDALRTLFAGRRDAALRRSA